MSDGVPERRDVTGVREQGAGSDPDTVTYVSGIPVPRWLQRTVHLAVFSGVPLAGLLLFGWDWRGVIVLYWLENLTVGVSTIVRILRSRPAADSRPLTVNGRAIDPQTFAANPLYRIGASAFFALHYGMFTLVHGVFVFALVAGAFAGPSLAGAPATGGSAPAAAPTMQPLDWVVAVLTWVIGSAVAVIAQAVGPRSTEAMGRMFAAPYARVVALHITIIVGAVLISVLGWPPVAAVLLIVLHAAVDVGSWTVAERRAPTSAGRATA